jgi:hypothetical protein
MTPVGNAKQPGEKDADEAAADAQAHADKVAKENEKDMESKAAYWAGPGVPPNTTPGDNATMAARKGGFDPSLQPGFKEGDLVESNHTTRTAANESALAKNKALAQKKEKK